MIWELVPFFSLFSELIPVEFQQENDMLETNELIYCSIVDKQILKENEKLCEKRGVSSMINFPDELDKLKYDYMEACKQYDIPTNNKAVMLYYMANKYENETDAEEKRSLQQLIFIAISDTGILLSHFNNRAQSEDIPYEFRQLKKRYLTLMDAYETMQIQKNEWKYVLAVKRLPNPDSWAVADDTLYSKQAREMTYLYRNILKVSERDSPELYNNLYYFLRQVHQTPMYWTVAPLFFFQLMVRHTKRLASNENLNIAPESIWSYKEYKILKDNGKNFRQYKAFSKLFRKLCKLYKNAQGVNLELCRYGFRQLSNLSEWIAEWQLDKRKKVFDRYFNILLDADLSSFEAWEPAEYSSTVIFGQTEAEEQNYFENFFEDYLQVNEAVETYVVDEIDYLLDWMKYIYQDIEKLQELTEKIYGECIPKLPKNKEWMMPCIKAQIYETMGEMLDKAVRAKILMDLG